MSLSFKQIADLLPENDPRFHDELIVSAVKRCARLAARGLSPFTDPPVRRADLADDGTILALWEVVAGWPTIAEPTRWRLPRRERDMRALRRLHELETPASCEPVHTPDSYCTCSELAKRFDVPRGALDQRLRRMRMKDKSGTGWHEVPDPTPRGARFLYSMKAVEPLIHDLHTVGKT